MSGVLASGGVGDGAWGSWIAWRAANPTLAQGFALETERQLSHNIGASYLLDQHRNSAARAWRPRGSGVIDMQQRQELRKAGLKITLPRLKILEILESAEQRHLSAEDIYKELLDSGEEIGLATVYRVLTQFESAGLVSRHNFEGGHSIFELDDGEHHDHMVCVDTGEVVEFTSDEIERLQEEVAEAHGYELIDHSLVLYVKPRGAVEG